jgi:hypothetical protein
VGADLAELHASAPAVASAGAVLVLEKMLISTWQLQGQQPAAAALLLLPCCCLPRCAYGQKFQSWLKRLLHSVILKWNLWGRTGRQGPHGTSQLVGVGQQKKEGGREKRGGRRHQAVFSVPASLPTNADSCSVLHQTCGGDYAPPIAGSCPDFIDSESHVTLLAHSPSLVQPWWVCALELSYLPP